MRRTLREAAAARKCAAREAATASKRAAAREARAVAIRGPKIKGRRLSFDECCVFANHVALDGSQVEFLKEVARERPTRHIYVCTIQGAHIDRQRAKRYFARKYSYSFIKKYLDLPTHINVFWNGRDIATVKVIFGKGSNVGVQITSNWKKVMRKTKMKEGEVFLFWFRGCSENGLKLILKRVD